MELERETETLVQENMKGIIQVDSWPWNLVKGKETKENLVEVEKLRSVHFFEMDFSSFFFSFLDQFFLFFYFFGWKERQRLSVDLAAFFQLIEMSGGCTLWLVICSHHLLTLHNSQVHFFTQFQPKNTKSIDLKNNK